MRRCRPLLFLPFLLLAAAAAGPDSPAEQLAGLFVQACVAHAGSVGGLRAWAAEHGLKSVPDPARPFFLNGQPGIAYDASDAGGKFALVSSDGGGCAAVAPHADPAALARSLDRFLPLAGAAATLASERDDPAERSLHHRTYRLTVRDRAFGMVVSTTVDGGTAMVALTGP